MNLDIQSKLSFNQFHSHVDNSSTMVYGPTKGSRSNFRTKFFDFIVKINKIEAVYQLSRNPQNSNGGSLPDLTAFQLQNNQFHQNLQLNNYNQRQKNSYHLQLLQVIFFNHFW